MGACSLCLLMVLCAWPEAAAASPHAASGVHAHSEPACSLLLCTHISTAQVCCAQKQTACLSTQPDPGLHSTQAASFHCQTLPSKLCCCLQYRERIIFLSKPVDESLGNQLVATMLYLDSENHKDLNLYINTSGGGVSTLLALPRGRQCLHAPVRMRACCVLPCRLLGRSCLRAVPVLRAGGRCVCTLLPPGQGQCRQAPVLHEQPCPACPHVLSTSWKALQAGPTAASSDLSPCKSHSSVPCCLHGPVLGSSGQLAVLHCRLKNRAQWVVPELTVAPSGQSSSA